ncbi:hypothetical protein B0H17DRAFT_1074139 [Mycena rosella]|uniref:Extracellular membrane protein CFEM domain-containing protein n=1 Tax=Mycena rosella TaxID=1033263 RepID=A0AAD7GAI1_MYCRO|nr:hypothetical protein B0H17DRAFT_1074139 [Mycena rosella]
MVKPGLSASVFFLFPFLPFSVWAASLARRSPAQTRAAVFSIRSTGPCDSVCEATDDFLSTTCGGVDVPCACTETFTRIQEACSRCELSNSANSTQLEVDTISVQNGFGEFQARCAKAGHPTPAMNLDDIELPFQDPISFTFETPQSIADPAFGDFIGAVCLRPDQITIYQCVVGGVSWVRCPNGGVAGILVRVSNKIRSEGRRSRCMLISRRATATVLVLYDNCVVEIV